MLTEVLKQSSGLVVLERFGVVLCITNEHEIQDYKTSSDAFSVAGLITWQAVFSFVKADLSLR